MESLYYSIDVECVATGTDHNARAVGQVSLVDQYEQVTASAHETLAHMLCGTSALLVPNSIAWH